MSQIKIFKVQQFVNGVDCGLLHYPSIDSDHLQKNIEDCITNYEKNNTGFKLEMYYKGVWDHYGS